MSNEYTGTPRMTEAEMERMADRIIQRRLSTDRIYREAEDADIQAAREEEVSEQVWRDLTNRFGEPT